MNALALSARMIRSSAAAAAAASAHGIAARHLGLSLRGLRPLATTAAPSTPPTTPTDPKASASAYPSAAQLTTQDLIAATTHIGHAPSRSTPQTLAYLLGTRQGLHMIDPNATLAHLRRASAFARLVAANGGIVLFVANEPAVQHLAVEAAQHAGAFYVTQWTPGTLTNAQQVVVKRQAMGDTQRVLPTSAPKPDLVVAVDLTSKHTMRAIKEARKLNIPTMAVVDSDVDPRWVTYPIPGNDDSVHSLELVVRTVAEAVRVGRGEVKRGSMPSLMQQVEEGKREKERQHEPWTDLRMQDFSDI